MDGEGFLVNGRVNGWRSFPVHGKKDGWRSEGASAWISLLLWAGGAVRVFHVHGVELRGVPPYAGELSPCSLSWVQRGQSQPWAPFQE